MEIHVIVIRLHNPQKRPPPSFPSSSPATPSPTKQAPFLRPNKRGTPNYLQRSHPSFKYRYPHFHLLTFSPSSPSLLSLFASLPDRLLLILFGKA